MWIHSIHAAELAASPSWKPEFFCSDGYALRVSHHRLLPIGEVVRERGESADPLTLANKAMNYIGLEDVEPITGRLLAVRTCGEIGVRSRSKTFSKDDILYGRLRPSLNKVYLARGLVRQGLCSNEFLVLIPDRTKVVPAYLRSIISTGFVTDLVPSKLGGSALPRLPLEQLLNIEVPIPTLETQESIAQLITFRLERHARLAELMGRFPEALMSDLTLSLETDHPESARSEVLDLSVDHGIRGL